jgi:hypothetical protein
MEARSICDTQRRQLAQPKPGARLPGRVPTWGAEMSAAMYRMGREPSGAQCPAAERQRDSAEAAPLPCYEATAAIDAGTTAMKATPGNCPARITPELSRAAQRLRLE